MISNDFTIDLATWGLSLEKARAQAAADNIANANTTGRTKTIDFKTRLDSVSSSLKTGEISRAYDVMSTALTADKTGHHNSNQVSLDVQVAELSSAQGRYKVIAEALTRKFGLMSISVKGR